MTYSQTPELNERTVTCFIGPQIASEIYDAMEGVVYDIQNRPGADLGPRPESILSLRSKLGEVKARKPLELTDGEAERLAHELDYASERVSEWNPSLARRMVKIIEQIAKHPSNRKT